MGCCTASSGKGSIVVDPKRVVEVKKRLKMERLNNSTQPYSEPTQALLQKAKAQPFNCKFVGLVQIHNYLMSLRDKNAGSKGIRDPSQLIFLDIRGETSSEYFEQVRVFKSQWFDLAAFVKKLDSKEVDPEASDWVDKQVKQFISMKYLFIIGNPQDFDCSDFRAFLSFLIDMPGKKPF